MTVCRCGIRMGTQSQLANSQPVGQIQSACSLDDSELLRASMVSEPAGSSVVPGLLNPRVVIHAGASVRIACDRGGDHNDGIANYGDIDIIPAGMAARWRIYGTDRFFVVGISQRFLEYVAESSEMNLTNTELHNRFQIRNPQIEHIGWSIKAEMEQGNPCGRIFMEGMATALAVEMLHNRGLRAAGGMAAEGRLPSRKLKRILSYVDENLGDDLTLRRIAHEFQVSVSLLKDMFRKSVGVSLHRYIIQRRVERAADMLIHRRLSISQIALETGFAHQSHMTSQMRRFLGVSPKELRNGSDTD